MGGVVGETRAFPWLLQRHSPVPLSLPYVSLKTTLGGSGGGQVVGRGVGERKRGRRAQAGWGGGSERDE